jgi:hypothetical protein
MNRRVNNGSGESPVKRYPCHVAGCPKSYTDRSSRRHHLHAVHGTMLYTEAEQKEWRDKNRLKQNTANRRRRNRNRAALSSKSCRQRTPVVTAAVSPERQSPECDSTTATDNEIISDTLVTDQTCPTPTTHGLQTTSEDQPVIQQTPPTSLDMPTSSSSLMQIDFDTDYDSLLLEID